MPRLPDWWDDHVGHLESRPTAEGLRALANAVSRGSKVERVRRLGGGISNATSAIRLRTRSGRAVAVVLKRFRSDKNSAKDEWRRLAFAQRLPVPSPEPLALDERGTWFGTPALVMRRLPGRPDVRPKRPESWLSEIARMHIQIHAANAQQIPAAFRALPYADGWVPPDAVRRTQTDDDAIARLRRRVSRAVRRDVVVGHGDPHPGNLLWSRGRISGVADWQHVKLSARGYDVAYMRADIAVLLGMRAADGYRDAYERLLGRPVEDLRLWDVVCGLNALQWSVLWVRPYREQGAELTYERARRRAAAFVRRSLGRT
jgi:aminoglycoside phosphotransferase (APT) family kinase protein